MSTSAVPRMSDYIGGTAGDADACATLCVAASAMMTQSSQQSPQKASGMKLAMKRGQ